MQKNTASQYFHCVVFNSSGRISGDAANLSCELSIDNGTRSALGTNTASEIGSTGEYTFPLTQAETNGHALSFTPESSNGYQVVGMPSNVIYTTESPNYTVVVPQSTIINATTDSGSEVVYQGSRWAIQLRGVSNTAYTSADYMYFAIKANDTPDSEAALQVKWTKTGDVTAILYLNGAAAGGESASADIDATSYVEDATTYWQFDIVVNGSATALVPTTNYLNGITSLGDIDQYNVPTNGYAMEWKLTGSDYDEIAGRGYITVLAGVNRIVES